MKQCYVYTNIAVTHHKQCGVIAQNYKQGKDHTVRKEIFVALNFRGLAKSS